MIQQAPRVFAHNFLEPAPVLRLPEQYDGAIDAMVERHVSDSVRASNSTTPGVPLNIGHEVMHVPGLLHEQDRPDRNSTVPNPGTTVHRPTRVTTGNFCQIGRGQQKTDEDFFGD